MGFLVPSALVFDSSLAEIVFTFHFIQTDLQFVTLGQYAWLRRQIMAIHLNKVTNLTFRVYTSVPGPFTRVKGQSLRPL